MQTFREQKTEGWKFLLGHLQHILIALKDTIYSLLFLKEAHAFYKSSKSIAFF